MLHAVTPVKCEREKWPGASESKNGPDSVGAGGPLDARSWTCYTGIIFIVGEKDV